MKRKKSLTIMLITLAVLVALTAVVKLTQKVQDKIAKTAAVLVDIDKEDITSFEMNVSSKTLAFYKEDDVWHYSDDEEFPVDQDAIDDLLENFEKVEASFVIEDVQSYADYGLKSPSATLTIKTADETYTIKMGDYSQMDSERYVDVGDGNAYLIENDLSEYLSTDKDEFFEGDSFADYDVLNEVAISKEENLDLFYILDESYGYSTAYSYYLKQDDEYKALSTAKAKSLISTITSLSTEDYVTYSADGDALSEYSLDEPAAVITLNYIEDDEAGTQTILLSEKSNKAYLYFEGSKIIYNIDSDSLDTILEADYTSLRATEVCNVDFDDVDSVMITLDGVSYNIVHQKSKYTLNDEEIEFDAVEDAIKALEINEFSDEKSSKKQEISFVISQDNDAYPTVTVEIYQLDGENCQVTFNGENLGTIERQQCVDLIEAINAIILNIE